MNAWQHESISSDHWVYFAFGVLAANVVWLTLVVGIGIGRWRKRSKDAGRETTK
jgi:hypothetical protein